MRISSTCSGQNRASLSEMKKAELLDAVARRASVYSTPELSELLGPSWVKQDRSYLRNRRPGYFGWERLLYAAEQLGVRVDLSIGEAA